jgi:hypothetical protein
MNEQTRPVHAVWWFPLKSWNRSGERQKKLTVEWMRGEAWIAHCLKVAQIKVTSRLPDVVARQVVINEDSFRAYKVGRDKPLIGSLKAINQVLPGTRETWDVGPDGLPLWGILEEDLSASWALVEDELANHTRRPHWSLLSDRNLPIRNMSPLQKAQALLENTVPGHFWSRTYWERQSKPVEGWAGSCSVDESEDENTVKNFTFFRHQDRDSYYLTLDEFISHKPNIVVASYAEGAKRAKTKKGKIGFADYRYITSPRRVLSLLALYKVLNSDTDVLAKDVAHYIFEGIDQALLELFGTPVHKFVSENI